MASSCSKYKHLLDRTLRKFFYLLGYRIGQTPTYFIIVPILLTALLATGVQQMNYNYDPEYLFSPKGGEAKYERAIQEEFFPVNFSDFKASRIARPGKFGRVIVAAKDGGSMLRTELWHQLLYLDQAIYNVTVVHEGNELRYAELCAQWNQYCYDNEILRLATSMPQIESGQEKMTYPLFFDPLTFEPYLLPIFFGGTVLDADEITVKSVEAIGLSYFLDLSEDWLHQVGDQWERQFLKDVQRFAPEFYPDLKIGMFVSNTPAWEMEHSKLSVTYILIYNVAMMVVFSFIAPSMKDSVRSKPWIGFSGMVSAVMAMMAGFGFCGYIGVEWITLNLAAPFLLFGIGFDDTFVMLSAWRRTSGRQLSVPERMGKTYADAGMSITYTSFTNIGSFLVGSISPFPSIRIFCIYSGTAMTFTYLWHITMFGGFLAWSGRSESKNNHGCFIWWKVKAKSLSGHKSWFYRNFMAGGVNPSDPTNRMDNAEHAGMAFFRDKVAALLNQNWFKCLLLVFYFVYIVGAAWGCYNIQEGLDKRNTANHDSYSVQYYNMDDAYFKEYAYTINVMIHGPNIDFSQIEVQKRVENIVSALEDSVYIDGNSTQNWLANFLDYVDRNKGYSDVNLPVETPEEFADTLKNVYLADPNNPERLDVAFTDDGTRVKAARFIIQGHHINNSKIEQLMLTDLREICARYSTEDLQIVVFHPWFIYIDQYLAITPQTIQTILVTAGVMILISIVFIPNFVCAIWITIVIVSIVMGVIGYMTWWGVRLDGVALINLIMCIGFSVDFSAHICYHYLTAGEDEGKPTSRMTPEDRIRDSLYALGTPIVQGAFSTLLGVAGLFFAPSYVFVTFAKMIFLVIMLGAFHGVILLPVLLSLMGPGSCTRSNESKSSLDTSGLSTPTLNAITCHKSLESQGSSSCYTVNLGYVEASQFVPYQYQQYLQTYAMHQQQTPQQQQQQQPPMPPPQLQNQQPPVHHHHHHEVAIVSSTTEQSSPATSTSSASSASRRGHRHHGRHHRGHQGGHRGERGHRQHRHHHHQHHVQVYPVQSRQVVEALRISNESGQTLQQQSEHNRQLDLHLAAISRMQQRSTHKSSHHQHKKVGRSRSHRPRLNDDSVVSTLPEGGQLQLPVTFVEKPVLRSTQSFPYEMFFNEASYSSDDSLRT